MVGMNEEYRRLISILTSQEWYGKLILTFEKGEIVHSSKNDSIKNISEYVKSIKL